MPTTTRLTRERLAALQQLDRLYHRHTELDAVLRDIRDSFVALRSVIEPRTEKNLTEEAKQVSDPDVRETLEKLAEDLRHVSVDSYSLGQAITHSEQLDELLDKAISAMCAEVTEAESDG
jgi:hypothetical protein